MISELDLNWVTYFDLPAIERSLSCRLANCLSDSCVDIRKHMALSSEYLEYSNRFGRLWKIAGRLNQNIYKKRNRIYKYVDCMLRDGQCIFLTFTFRDDVLFHTSFDTRRKYVQRFLKDHAELYIANLDFGENFQREHYHAIVRSDYIKYIDWQHGSLNGQKVRCGESDAIRVSKYVQKIGNHALKSTAKGKIIYSRKLANFYKNFLQSALKGDIL